MKTNWLDFKYCILINAGCKILNSIMDINTELVFEKPIQVYRDYPIYSIANFNGIIMVNTILNGERRLALEENREPKHTLTTKGTESYNFIQTVISIIREEASYKEVLHPEWANKEPKITLG